MIERLQELPPGIDAIRARGTVTRDDYRSVVRPLLEEARHNKRRLRLLYQVGPQLDRFTPGAMLEDAVVGMEYLNQVDRCAVVTDLTWIAKMTRLFSSAMPCAMRVFEYSQWPEAVAWLNAPTPPSVPHSLLPQGVLLVEPNRRFRREDFEELAKTMEPWIAEHGKLIGLVAHTRAFPPGWENIGSLVRHVQFLRGLKGKVERVALATDGQATAQMAAGLAELAGVTVRIFRYSQLDDAIVWVRELSQ